MGSVGEVIKEVKSDKYGIWLFRVVCLGVILLFVRHFYKDYNGQHSYLLFGLSEVNNQKEVRIHDTIIKYEYDTIIVRQGVSKQPKQIVKNEQKIDSRGGGVQNNAPNQGNQAGRDFYNIVYEKTFTQSDLKVLYESLEKFRKDKKIESKNICLSITTISNGQKIFNQIDEYLSQTDYTIIGVETMDATLNFRDITFQFDKAAECIKIIVGLF